MIKTDIDIREVSIKYLSFNLDNHISKVKGDRDMIQKTIVVKNKSGLHARPAAQFVKIANKYKSDIEIEKQGMKVNAKSIMGVMSLAVSPGTEIAIYAKGKDEAEAMEELVALIESHFGEE